MIWHRECGVRAESIALQARRQRVKFDDLPEWMRDRPSLLPGVKLALSMYLACETCRSTAFGLGPIPYTALSAWCRDYGVRGADRRLLIELVMAADAKVVAHAAEASAGGART